jgi:deferrochelatase/peroxidase EfeB
VSSSLLQAENSGPRSEAQTSLTVAFTYRGLEALGVPPSSLASFPREFREGMAARAEELGDVGESSPEHWEHPLGSPDVHVAISVLGPDQDHLEAVAERARSRYGDLSSVEVVWRQDCYQLPTGRTSFGFKDGIGNPDVEGSGLPVRNPTERPIKAGEFILGYPDETGSLPPAPAPEILGPTAPTWCSASSITRSRRTGVISGKGPATARTNDCSARRWWAAGLAGRHWRLHPKTTTPT